MVLYDVVEMLLDILGGGQEVTASTSLQKDISPLERAKLALACEKRWHVVIHDELLLDMQTLGDMANHIDALLLEGTYQKPATDDDRLSWYYESEKDEKRRRGN